MQRYHRHSNVEITFSMIKGQFGERLRSKTHTAESLPATGLGTTDRCVRT
jgi:hypothetical protein